MAEAQMVPVGPGQMTDTSETAASAVAAQAAASIQARYVVAMQRPRDMDDVRVRLLKECARPGFAEGARYEKPIGRGKVVGPSIRFAEAAIRLMTNISVETMATFDNYEKRIVRVTVTDLEANVPYFLDVVIEKTVERSSLREGQVPVGMRTNTRGATVYIIAATEDDLLVKQAALVSKALRTLALRLVPGDIIEECMAKVVQTTTNRAAQDPDGERKKLVDAFSALGVKPSDLKSYLGHELAASSPSEMVELRAVYAALKEGEATWGDALAVKLHDGDDAPPASVASAGKRITERVEKLRGKTTKPAKGDDDDAPEPGSNG